MNERCCCAVAIPVVEVVNGESRPPNPGEQSDVFETFGAGNNNGMINTIGLPSLQPQAQGQPTQFFPEHYSKDRERLELERIVCRPCRPSSALRCCDSAPLFAVT